MTQEPGVDAPLGPAEPAAACLADDYRSRRRRGSTDPRNARRKAALEVLMMWLDVGFTVYASCVLVAGTGHSAAVVPALGAGGLAALGVVALRLYVPAKVRPQEPEPHDEPSSEGGWDVGSLLLAALVIPVWMALGLLLRGWLLVAVVLGFAVFASSATTLGVVAAIVVSITAAVCAEYAVVHPLLRRWGIAPD